MNALIVVKLAILPRTVEVNLATILPRIEVALGIVFEDAHEVAREIVITGLQITGVALEISIVAATVVHVRQSVEVTLIIGHEGTMTPRMKAEHRWSMRRIRHTSGTSSYRLL